MRLGKGIDLRRLGPAFGLVLVAALTVLSGVIHGYMSNRWGLSQDLLAAARKLENLPDRFATWELQSSYELGDRVARELQCAGYVVREYRDQETTLPVTVTVLIGPSGPMSVHVPEICLGSRDFTKLDEPRLVVLKGPDAENQEFWCQTFRANNLNGDVCRIYYAWSDGGPWSAPKNPRLTLADRPYLYKIQLVGYLPPQPDLKKDDACRKFLEDFIPILKAYLVGSSNR